MLKKTTHGPVEEDINCIIYNYPLVPETFIATHFLGDRPFIVHIEPSMNTTIYHNNFDLYDSSIDLYNKLDENYVKDLDKIHSISSEKIFIGKGKDKYENGASILIKYGQNMYEFIGLNIYTFTSISEILTFSVKLDDYDGPYSYAIDIDKNVYLLEDGIILLQNEKINYENPFLYNENIKTLKLDQYIIEDRRTLRRDS